MGKGDFKARYAKKGECLNTFDAHCRSIQALRDLDYMVVDTDTGHSDPPCLAFWSDEVNVESLSLVALCLVVVLINQ